MTFFTRAAGRTAAAILFSAAALFAQPALAADDGGIAVATTATAASPGLESLDKMVERAIAAQDLVAPPAGLVVADETKPERPALDRSRPLELLVADYASDQARDGEADCLASAVYFESNGEPFAGQLAVAEVIINRARSGRFASTLCGVITQRSQFSFVRGGRIPSPPRSSQGWRNAVAIAHIALDDLADSPVASALFFHARYVSPRWRLERLATVGNHVFYR
jgi:hypothetical protein